MRKNISSGSEFEEKIGYSRAVVVDNWVLVSGTTGYDYANMTISADVVEQAEQCFQNVIWALEEAGASINDVVKVQYIFPNAAYFERCWCVLKKYLGEVKPVATMIEAGLANADMKIEIEVTAIKQNDKTV